MDFQRSHEVFAEFSKQYGNVYTIWLPKPYVVVMDFENIREAFLKKGDDYSGRSGLYPDSIFQNVENGGVVFSQGDNWKEQRRVSLHILRDFGMGKNLMEEQVFVANIINKTLFGFGYEYNNCDRLVEGVEAMNSTFIGIRPNAPVLITPIVDVTFCPPN
ncbi:hypothetical protein ANCDUO_22987 [Ancylostoma duodenale]|uniref:Unspecific monooxygenase n=1 Tax=Ancylostoma duodenale TaxID=51022 RepID=A0A0C2FPY6_9BILA|nr:hypothetical protein ANCDUO_22987 [Ancylostoma duodenale]